MLDPCAARTHPQLKSLGDVALAAVLRGTFAFIERYCRRTFAVTDYDVLLPGTNTRSLHLPQYPVTTVVIRSQQLPAVQITNDSPTAQSTTVEVLPDRLRLVTTENGTVTPTDLTFEQHPTLGSLSAAINALGGHWRAIPTERFDGWSSADIGVYGGVRSARQAVVSLSPHWWYHTDYRLHADRGEVIKESGWWGGPWHYRVQYTAGYEALPDDLQLAAVELAGVTQAMTKIDPTLLSESLGQYSYTRATQFGWQQLGLLSRSTIQSYRKTDVPYFLA